jgi:glycogen(starch) synthase
MHVLMLGWEFPPFITGGLGTACHGLTRAMDQRGIRITFVLPRPVGEDTAAHVNLVSPAPAGGTPTSVEERGFVNVRFLAVSSGFIQPYQSSAGEGPVGAHTEGREDWPGESAASVPRHAFAPSPGGADYGGDLIEQVERYARFCLQATRGLHFDIIHAHDWMTWPAGLWIARATGRPLIAHVHSTEFDRSGERINQRIYDIERRGMHGAMRIICVSQLTRNLVIHRYGVPPARVEVVYNGVEIDPAGVGMSPIRRKDRIVLYFGRITYQKGPEYFLRAAKRVLEQRDDVKFVVAGSGDMARHMIEMAAEMGIGQKVLFTGFLRGDDINRVFSLADLYVMPSVCEPFGIAPLEAISHDVPVLISKSSGVSEVLSHALKVDFWDVDDMANKIIAVLKHPPLGQTLREHGRMEIRRLSWAGAAERCEQIYRAVIEEMRHHARAGR